MTETLFWHDYETFGTDPRRDRPCQFAGLRTDLDLQPLGEPLVLYCRPAADYLPAPEACLLTGITPQLALREGVPESEFIGAIEAELARPGTCGVGYNSIRFDDEVTRNTLYRNLRDPYAREWRDGNSRWDVIDLMRMAHALRPEGLEWPRDESGLPVFRLERLTAANGIEHGRAHDAMADVRATIALVRRLRAAQPRLFDWYYGLRRKSAVLPLLAPEKGVPLLHVSGMYPRATGCIAPILSLARRQPNPNEFVVIDLRASPEALIEQDVENLREKLFTPSVDLPEGEERLPLKTVYANRSPALSPMSTLDAGAAERWGIDLQVVRANARRLLATRAVWQPKLEPLFERAFDADEAAPDPDLAIYSGGFFSDPDRALMRSIIESPPQQLVGREFPFRDPRLAEMLFRYRARSYPQTLTGEERRRWRNFCAARLVDEGYGGTTIKKYQEELTRLETAGPEGADEAVLSALKEYLARICREAGIDGTGDAGAMPAS